MPEERQTQEENRPTSLNEYDKDEWFDICRVIAPNLTRLRFDPMWIEFAEIKRKRKLQ